MPSIPETRASLILRLPDAADVKAWQEFVGVYGPLVYRLARRHGLQPADADDLVQEVLAAIARSIEDWLANPDRGSFRAWLFRIARNIAVNFLTRRKHRAWGTGDSDVARMLQQHADPNGDTSDEFELEYRREVFRWAADQVRATVTEKNWQAFWLTSIEEQPISDVAKQMKMSLGSTYIARSRIMTRLRELVRRFEEHGA
jgi:RNA polymerase sigma-70 factor (ECF subfamily)